MSASARTPISRFLARPRASPLSRLPSSLWVGASIGGNKPKFTFMGWNEPFAKGSFQPMNVNFGLFPPIEAPTHSEDGKRLKGEARGRAKKREMGVRALADIDAWLTE